MTSHKSSVHGSGRENALACAYAILLAIDGPFEFLSHLYLTNYLYHNIIGVGKVVSDT
jgi:hypothetical protein